MHSSQYTTLKDDFKYCLFVHIGFLLFLLSPSINNTNNTKSLELIVNITPRHTASQGGHFAVWTKGSMQHETREEDKSDES